MTEIAEAAARLKAQCGRGAFSVRATEDVAHDDQGVIWTLWLDPAEPFLNDHRPGGKPLFGTVCDIEAMAAGAAQLLGLETILSLSTLRVGRPLVFETQAPRPIEIHARPIGTPKGSAFACRLVSVGEAGPQDHASCVFPAEGGALALPAHRSVAPGLISPVVGGDVYRAFFHGPAFQVIAAVERSRNGMVAALSPSLPAWTRTAGETTYAAPRLIEFAMQTAGLLHLARSGEMLVPHSIGRIERASPLDVDSPAPLFASASASASGVERALDVDILDVDGRVHMRICDYVCTPLPYAADHAALTALRQLLNARPDLN